MRIVGEDVGPKHAHKCRLGYKYQGNIRMFRQLRINVNKKERISINITYHENTKRVEPTNLNKCTIIWNSMLD